ncbi:MAG TPA: peptide ABC transporter substrate-binding protein [Anaerolineae bacterium]|nr:peptide ABC transporter substrate-binding protein [Anaerolineae bacterium]
MKKILPAMLVLGLLLVVSCAQAPITNPTAQPPNTAALAGQPTSAPTSAAAPTTAPSAPSGANKVFRRAAFEPDSLDPSKGGPGFQEFQNLYEPLVDAYAQDGQIHPLAAESYKISDDGLTVTFTLRDGLKWSDGKPVVAEDFRYAWLRQLDPKTASYVPDEFYAIKNGAEFNQGKITDPNQVGIQAPDDKTLVVTLAAPAPYWLRYVGTTDYVPVRKDIIEKYGDKWMEAGNFVGNGPYMLQEWKHDQSMVFVRNPNYNGPWKDSIKIDRLEFKLVQDPDSQGLPAYEANEVDAATIPATELDRIKADAKMSKEIHTIPSAGTTILIFDTKNKPTDDVRVRQALSMAIDREALANQVLKGGYLAPTSFSPRTLASYNPSTFQGYNPEKAKQLLADAGYPGGKGFPTLELYSWNVQRALLETQAIKAMWKDTLGIDVNLNPLDPKAMRDWRIARKDQPFNVYYAWEVAGILDPIEYHNAQLDPEQNVRNSRYADSQYVQLIRDAKKETDPAKRAKMYQDAEAIINRDVPIIPITEDENFWVVKPNVMNFDQVTTALTNFIRAAQPPGLDISQ